MKNSWSRRLLIRYTLLQLPAIALLIITLILVEQWLDLPAWLSWGVVIFWVAKDIALFPFVWRAYDWEGKTAIHSMVGQRGLTKERLSPSGYVQIGNELWRALIASGCPSIEAGQSVRVCQVQGLTLIVEPIVGEE